MRTLPPRVPRTRVVMPPPTGPLPAAYQDELFDADRVALAFGEVPPPDVVIDWTCPTCGDERITALALVGDRWICERDFYWLRRAGCDPKIRDVIEFPLVLPVA